MNVLIIEDEMLAAEKLETMLKQSDPEIRVLARLGSIKESVSWLNHNSCDLIFLDIQLSDGLSFSIFEQAVVTTPIIFTTAYDQYAINAFRLNSISYLLKPIRKNELEESLNKYKNLKKAFAIDFDSLFDQIRGKQPEFKKRFLIQIGEKIKKIETSEIAYFYAYDKACYLRTFSGNDYPAEYSLDKLETMLNPVNYFRINRKYLVHMDAIAHMTAYSRGRVKLELRPKADDEFETVVSIDRSTNFKQWLNS